MKSYCSPIGRGFLSSPEEGSSSPAQARPSTEGGEKSVMMGGVKVPDEWQRRRAVRSHCFQSLMRSGPSALTHQCWEGEKI